MTAPAAALAWGQRRLLLRAALLALFGLLCLLLSDLNSNKSLGPVGAI